MNASKKIDITHYSFEELRRCIKPFEEYKSDHGDTPPIHTGYAFFDGVGNWSVSCLGFKANQKYVVPILDIINNIEKDHEKQSWLTEPSIVAFALEKIKKIYDQMLEAGIKKGKTMDALSILFDHFHFPYKETGKEYEDIRDRIFHKVKDLSKVPDDKEQQADHSKTSLGL